MTDPRADTIRGGLDSLAWLLNNADKHDTPTFHEFVRAAREDRDAALAALGGLLADAAEQRARIGICWNCGLGFEKPEGFVEGMCPGCVNAFRLEDSQGRVAALETALREILDVPLDTAHDNAYPEARTRMRNVARDALAVTKSSAKDSST